MPYSDKGSVDDYAAGKMKSLLMCPSKGGKTFAAILTSPTPLFVINADPGGLTGVAKKVKFDGKDYDGEDCFDERTLEKTVQNLSKNPKRFKTVVLDTITLLSQNIEAECMRRNEDKRAAYGELKNIMLSNVSQILQLPCHVIINAHFMEAGPGGEAGSLGILPAMSGSAKTIIPAMINDWLWLDVTPGKNGEPTKREFLLNAQGNWMHGCRSIQTTGRMPADFTAFIKKAGLKM